MQPACPSTIIIHFSAEQVLHICMEGNKKARRRVHRILASLQSLFGSRMRIVFLIFNKMSMCYSLSKDSLFFVSVASA